MEETIQKNSAVKIVGIIMVGIIVLAAVFQRNFLPSEETVSVTGRGSVPVTVDAAIINLGVATVKAATPEDALQQTSAKVDKIKGVFVEMQIPASDWQITGYAFDPQFESGSSTDGQDSSVPSVKGYDGFQRITVKLTGIDKDPKKIDNFIGRMIKEGVNKVGTVKFISSNIDALKKEARDKAIEEAKGKATILENKLGIKLKGFSGIDETEVAVPGENDSYYYDNNPITFAGSTDQVSINPSISSQAEVIIETTLQYHFR